jgi:hypothetical protein
MNKRYARSLADGMYEFPEICDQCLTCAEILTILSTSLLLFFSRRNAAKRCMPIEWQQTARVVRACGSGRNQTNCSCPPALCLRIIGGQAFHSGIHLSFLSQSIPTSVVSPRRPEVRFRVCLAHVFYRGDTSINGKEVTRD